MVLTVCPLFCVLWDKRWSKSGYPDFAIVNFHEKVDFKKVDTHKLDASLNILFPLW